MFGWLNRLLRGRLYKTIENLEAENKRLLSRVEDLKALVATSTEIIATLRRRLDYCPKCGQPLIWNPHKNANKKCVCAECGYSENQ